MGVCLRLATAATALLTAAACAMNAAPVVPASTGAGVRFELDRADATSVTLAGSFNQWSASSHPLVRQKQSGRWVIVVPLPPGEHTFMYLVHGSEWVSPPKAEDYADDGFGAKNGIVVVRR